MHICIHGKEDRILRSLILTQYQSVTDGFAAALQALANLALRRAVIKTKVTKVEVLWKYLP